MYMFNSSFNILYQVLLLFSGSLIYRLRGIDPDGDTLQFGIREQVGSDILRIEAISSNEANIYLIQELDREVINSFVYVYYFHTRLNLLNDIPT